MTLNIYPGVAVDSTDTRQLVRDLAVQFRQVLQGKLNATVEFTPAAATSTDIVDVRLTPNSVLLIEPTSSGGAAELAAGTMFVDESDRGAGQCTVTHSTGAAGNLFRLIILS